MNTPSPNSRPPLSVKKGEVQGPDLSHVIPLFFSPDSKERIRRMIGDLLDLDSTTVDEAVRVLHEEFTAHRDIDIIWKDHFLKVEGCLPAGVKSTDLTEAQRLLIGSTFTKEWL